jgi:hypothetical protein
METLIEKIAKYNNCVQGLLDRVDEYETRVKKEIPFEFWGECGLEKFGRESNAIWWCANAGKPLPGTVKECGQEYYISGDYGSKVEFCNRGEIVEFAKGLPDLVGSLEKRIERLVIQAEQI